MAKKNENKTFDDLLNEAKKYMVKEENLELIT